MKYFRDTLDGTVHGLEDGDLDFKKATWVEIEESETEVYNAPSEEEYETTRVKNIELECSAIIYSRYSREKQTNVALGLYPEEYKKTMVDFITDIRNQCSELIKDKTKTRLDFIVTEEK